MMIFGQNLQKKSKIEKLNITLKFCIFKLAYSWVTNRMIGEGEGFGIIQGSENPNKINSRDGVEEIYLIR